MIPYFNIRSDDLLDYNRSHQITFHVNPKKLPYDLPEDWQYNKESAYIPLKVLNQYLGQVYGNVPCLCDVDTTANISDNCMNEFTINDDNTCNCLGAYSGKFCQLPDCNKRGKIVNNVCECEKAYGG